MVPRARRGGEGREALSEDQAGHTRPVAAWSSAIA